MRLSSTSARIAVTVSGEETEFLQEFAEEAHAVFDESELDRALRAYRQRDRRFGRILEMEELAS